jgi:magnesium transporter
VKTTGGDTENAVLRGWSWKPSQGCKTLCDWSEVRVAWGEPDSRLWIDLQKPTQQDVQTLNGIIDLDDAALEDAVDGPERPRVDEYENYLALFFYGVLSVDERGHFSPHKIVAFCGERFLVTIHPEAMLSVSSLHDRCQKHGATLFERGVDVLLYRLMDTLVDNYLALLDHFESRVDKLESDSFNGRTDDSILRSVAEMRTDLMEVRRLASAQHSLLAPMARGEFDYVSENLGTEFRHVEEHLAHTLDRIECLRERLSGTLHNYHSTLTKKTNDIVRVLTIFAAVVLPLSLIAGIYGMNVPVWPPGESPQSFWGILTLMAALGGGLLWFFRTRKWF